MRARSREFDWEKTPLGPVAGWPPSLRLMIGMCLNNRFPMCIWWGPELTMIYNDAYAPIFGQRHPGALGASARDVWADAWSVVDVQVQAVWERGEASWNDRVLVQSERNGVMADSWFTFSLSPLVGETGGVAGMLLTSMEETEVVLRERELSAIRDRLTGTLAAAEVSSWTFEVLTNRLIADAGLARRFGIAPEVAAAGAPLDIFVEAIHPEDRDATMAAVSAALASGDVYEAEYRLAPRVGAVSWVLARGRVVRDETGAAVSMSGVLIDITERKRSEQLVAAQNEVLQLVASETSLPVILEKLVRQVEAGGGGDTVASILLLDDDGKLRHGAAPSLPDAYNEVVDGIASGEKVGTCGRAAFLREVVITPDLAADPNWAPLKSEVAALGLLAAWSEPILSTDGRILGTFGSYFRTKRAPTAAERAVVDFLSKTAALAIERSRAQEGLRESEERFRMLADNISQFAWMGDGTGALFWYNQRWFDYTGTNLEAMQGWGWQQVQHPDHVERVTEKFARHVREGKVWEDTFPLRGADGEYRWFLSRAFPIRDAAGDVARWFGTNTDITELREAQEELRLSDERFRQIADTMPQIVWGAGPDGTLDYYNRRWFEFIGLADTTDLEAARWDKYLHPEDLPFAFESWQASLTTGNIYQIEFRARGADGNYRWFLARALPIRDAEGSIVRWFGTCTDINDRRRLQEENFWMMERERAARKASEDAGRMKDDFLATLSHELRTPLNPVLLIASEAAENMSLPPDVRADFAAIAKNVGLEARLIDDLLDLTRITRGKMALTVASTDLHGVLRDAVENVGAEIAEKKIQLVVDFSAPSSLVMGDAVRLQQVFWNILRNAAKFTPHGGRIALSTGVAAEGTRVEVRIIDSGMGMSADEVGRLFNAFTQGDHAGSTGSHRFGGLGLGLAISRMLVELHSGRITGASGGPGQGSTFTVQLPLHVPGGGSSPDVSVPEQRLAGNPGLRPSRILLVEDHEPTRTALAHLLIRRRYEVAEAGTMAEALAIAATQKFDLLLTDIGLPDGDGNQLMRTLRQSSEIKGIALTGYGMEEDIARSRRAGFTTHLTKPIRVQALDAALASAAAMSSQ